MRQKTAPSCDSHRQAVYVASRSGRNKQLEEKRRENEAGNPKFTYEGCGGWARKPRGVAFDVDPDLLLDPLKPRKPLLFLLHMDPSTQAPIFAGGGGSQEEEEEEEE